MKLKKINIHRLLPKNFEKYLLPFIVIFFLTTILSYHNYFYKIKEFNVLEEETRILNVEEINIIFKENENILNHIDQKQYGYKILKYKNKKVIYIRDWSRYCDSKILYSLKVKNNKITTKMVDRRVFICKDMSLHMTETFWLPKNQDFDKVRIYKKQYRSKIKFKELNTIKE